MGTILLYVFLAIISFLIVAVIFDAVNKAIFRKKMKSAILSDDLIKIKDYIGKKGKNWELDRRMETMKLGVLHATPGTLEELIKLTKYWKFADKITETPVPNSHTLEKQRFDNLIIKLAFSSGREDIIRVLHKSNIINKKVIIGNLNPLAYAVTFGNLNLLKTMIELGYSNKEFMDQALTQSIKSNSRDASDIDRFLVENGAKPNICEVLFVKDGGRLILNFTSIKWLENSYFFSIEKMLDLGLGINATCEVDIKFKVPTKVEHSTYNTTVTSTTTKISRRMSMLSLLKMNYRNTDKTEHWPSADEIKALIAKIQQRGGVEIKDNRVLRLSQMMQFMGSWCVNCGSFSAKEIISCEHCGTKWTEVVHVS